MFVIKKLLFLILIPAALFARKPDLLFEHISLQEGLSQSTINCIYQDKLGFIWFGTSNGLNKYDGYNFTVYHHNPSNSSSLSSDMINRIFEDSDGNLWIGTENGINLFNRFPEKFTSFLNFSIMSIEEDKQKNIIAGSFVDGLFYFDRNKKTFLEFGLKKENDIYIYCSYKDASGIIWYGTSNGLLKFDPAKKSAEYFNWDKENKRIFSIAEKDGILFAGTQGRGIKQFNKHDEKFITDSGKLSSGLTQARITSILFDSQNRMWIGSMGEGLFLYNRSNGSITRYNADDNVSIGDNYINSVVEDNSSILWFGSSRSGIHKLSLNKIKFAHIKKENGNPNSIISNNIYRLYKDHQGIVWAGSSEGLSGLNRVTGKVKQLTKEFISSIFEDKNSDLWVGTRKGLLKFDKNKNLIKTGIKDTLAKSFQKEIITDIIKDEKNNILFLSSFGAIYSLDQNTQRLTRTIIKKDNHQSLRTFSFIKDKEGIFWIGSYNGLVKFDPKNNSTKFYLHNEKDQNSISNDVVFSVYEDNAGNLWCGTYGGGLNKFLKAQNKFYHFSEEEGLPNNVVYSALPDKKGNLWLSTNKGICRFNTITNEVRVFDVTDGLQSYEFNSGAFYLADDGEMFFGGLNGFNTFYPEEIKDNPFIPSVALTSIKILDKNYDPLTKKIILPYNANFINFEFIALDYLNPARNKYKYKLEGFENKFVEAKNRRYASYTNLEPGEYRFVVIGSNSDEVWNNKGASVYLVITPPFWRTWWFYILLTAAVLLMLYSIYRFRVNQKLNRIAFVEKMRKRIADDFHDELGHKLTKISLYTQLMKNELQGKLNGSEEYLIKINETANRLYDDTKDFIWSVDPGKDTLYDLAVYLKDFGDELFDKTGISFRVNEISDNLQKFSLPMNWKRQLILLFKEAMNNVLKHSKCLNVELIVTMDKDNFEFILKDDGEGMVSENDGKGRGLINMNNRASKIGGKLIVESQCEGTVIKFIGNIQNTGVINEN